MAWIKGTAAAFTGAVIGLMMSGCCCGVCDSRDPQAFMYEEDRDAAPTANIYRLNAAPLRANAGIFENSQNNRLVRIRGLAPNGKPREFDVFFGPGEEDLPTGRPGKGRFINGDPGWECTQGYAVLRGVRPFGSTQYVKSSSDSTTIIMLVDKDTKEERFLLTEGKDGAKVYLKSGTEPAAPNLKEGEVIIATMDGSDMKLAPPKPIADDPVSVALLDYLEQVKGAEDLQIGK